MYIVGSANGKCKATNSDNYFARFQERLSGVEKASGGWVAKCPCPDHGYDGEDRKPSLSFTIGQEGKIIFHCHAGCDWKDILLAIGLESKDLRPSEGESPEETLSVNSADEPVGEDHTALIVSVYERFLAHLELRQEDRGKLHKRGLSDREIDARGYRSFRALEDGTLPQLLHKEFGEDLYLVPGFINKEGTPYMPVDIAGILVPVRNPSKQVVAIKSRREGDPKFLYLSSGKMGRSPGAPVHCPLNLKNVETDKVRLTEGEMKADVATALSPTFTLGVPGVSAWWKIPPVLKDLGVQSVLLSFDWPDVQGKKPVREQFRKCLDALTNDGFRVGVETWTEPAKGIDDLLAAGGKPQEAWGTAEFEKLINGLPDFGDFGAIVGMPNSPKTSDATLLLAETYGDEDDFGDFGDILEADCPFVRSGQAIPFPTSALPLPIREYVEGVVDATGFSQDFIAGSVLSVAGAAAGDPWELEVNQSYKLYPLVWVGNVGDPSSKKSPAAEVVLGPLFKIDEEQHKAFEADYQKVDEENKQIGWRNKKKEKDCDGEEYPELETLKLYPTLKSTWINDITSESMAAKLKDNPHGLLYYHDELTALIAACDQYRGGKGSDREKLMGLYSRAPYKVDRKTNKGPKDNICVGRPFVCILGGIPPDKLHTLRPKDGGADGLIERMLFAFPDFRSRRVDDRNGIPPELTDRWNSVVSVLWNNTEKKVMKLSPEAWDEWDKCQRLLVDEANKPETPTYVKGFLGKCEGNLGRFVAILQALKWATATPAGSWNPSVVDKETVLAAWDLIGYFVSTAWKVYGRGSDTVEEKLLTKILSVANALKPKELEDDEQFTGRKVFTATTLWKRLKHTRELKNADKFKQYVGKLCGKKEFLKVDEPRTGSGRRRDLYELNPKLLETMSPKSP